VIQTRLTLRKIGLKGKSFSIAVNFCNQIYLVFSLQPTQLSWSVGPNGQTLMYSFSLSLVMAFGDLFNLWGSAIYTLGSRELGGNVTTKPVTFNVNREFSWVRRGC
jgi:hypothetical protein